MPRRKPVPQPQQQLSETWAQDLTAQFRRTLSTKRMNDLSRRPASQRRTPSALPTEFIVEPRPTSQHSAQTLAQAIGGGRFILSFECQTAATKPR